MQHNQVFIVGHSGAGKGVLAQAIAEKLGWKFVNADVLGCASHTGRKTQDTLGKDGQAHFHRTLNDILSHLLTQEKIVVTTDTDIVCDQTARELLQSTFTVHLDVSTPIQIERLSNYRPLLPVDFEALLNELHEERDSLYQSVASFSLSSDDGNIDAHAQAVIEAMD